MTATEIAINDLTVQTTALLAAVNFSKTSLDIKIAEAVVVSENAAQIPLVTMAVSIIDTQTIFVNNLTN
jgi:hypothetical protein|tara:strand:- start:11747 stop:11953 length:207 start_codon:yes stop_codon:yes gene_type:complete